MWLEFQSRPSQRDFEGFLRALRFLPPSKLTPSLIHLALVLCSEVKPGSCSGIERLAGGTAPSVQPRWAAPLVIQSTTARKGDQQVRYRKVQYSMYGFYTQFPSHISALIIDKTKCELQKFVFFKRVDKGWITTENVSSVSPSSEHIEELWGVTVYMRV